MQKFYSLIIFTANASWFVLIGAVLWTSNWNGLVLLWLLPLMLFISVGGLAVRDKQELMKND